MSSLCNYNMGIFLKEALLTISWYKKDYVSQAEYFMMKSVVYYNMGRVRNSLNLVQYFQGSVVDYVKSCFLKAAKLITTRVVF